MINAQQIYQLIPHRYPFLLIDRVVEHDPGVRAQCTKNITLGEEIMHGHFPGNPIYPGVLLIEMGLQTTHMALTDIETVLSEPVAENHPNHGFVLSVEKFKFQRPAVPGDVLSIRSEISASMMGMHKAKIEITNDAGEVVAAGTVSVGAGRQGADQA